MLIKNVERYEKNSFSAEYHWFFLNILLAARADPSRDSYSEKRKVNLDFNTRFELQPNEDPEK